MVIAPALFTLSAIGSGFPFSIWDFIFSAGSWWSGRGAGQRSGSGLHRRGFAARAAGRLGPFSSLAIVIGIFVAPDDQLRHCSAGRVRHRVPGGWGCRRGAGCFGRRFPRRSLYGLGALCIPESRAISFAPDAPVRHGPSWNASWARVLRRRWRKSASRSERTPGRWTDLGPPPAVYCPSSDRHGAF